MITGSPDSALPTRRRVVTTAAWAVPAIAVATAAPAMAVSGPAKLSTSITQASTFVEQGRIPTNDGYVQTSVTNANTMASTALTATLVVTLKAGQSWGAVATGNSPYFSDTAAGTGTGQARTFTFSVVMAAYEVAGNSSEIISYNIDSGSGTTDFVGATVVVTTSPGGTGTTTDPTMPATFVK